MTFYKKLTLVVLVAVCAIPFVNCEAVLGYEQEVTKSSSWGIGSVFSTVGSVGGYALKPVGYALKPVSGVYSFASSGFSAVIENVKLSIARAYVNDLFNKIKKHKYISFAFLLILFFAGYGVRQFMYDVKSKYKKRRR